MGGGASKREDGLQRLKKIKARIDSGDLDGALAECNAVQEAMLVNKRLAAIAVPLGELRAEAKRLLDRLQKVHSDGLTIIRTGEAILEKARAASSPIRDEQDPDPAREHFARALERYRQGMKTAGDRSLGWFADRQLGLSAAVPGFEVVHESLQLKSRVASVRKKGTTGAAFAARSFHGGRLVCDFVVCSFKGNGDDSDIFIGLVQQGVFSPGDFWYDAAFEDKAWFLSDDGDLCSGEDELDGFDSGAFRLAAGDRVRIEAFWPLGGGGATLTFYRNGEQVA
jgi:hypothetical protein